MEEDGVELVAGRREQGQGRDGDEGQAARGQGGQEPQGDEESGDDEGQIVDPADGLDQTDDRL